MILNKFDNIFKSLKKASAINPNELDPSGTDADIDESSPVNMGDERASLSEKPSFEESYTTVEVDALIKAMKSIKALVVNEQTSHSDYLDIIQNLYKPFTSAKLQNMADLLLAGHLFYVHLPVRSAANRNEQIKQEMLAKLILNGCKNYLDRKEVQYFVKIALRKLNKEADKITIELIESIVPSEKVMVLKDQLLTDIQQQVAAQKRLAYPWQNKNFIPKEAKKTAQNDAETLDAAVPQPLFENIVPCVQKKPAEKSSPIYYKEKNDTKKRKVDDVEHSGILFKKQKLTNENDHDIYSVFHTDFFTLNEPLNHNIPEKISNRRVSVKKKAGAESRSLTILSQKPSAQKRKAEHDESTEISLKKQKL